MVCVVRPERTRLVAAGRRWCVKNASCHLYTSQGTLRRSVVGFTDVKRHVLACLDSGAFGFEMRDAMSEKNLLATGAVTVAEVRRMIGQCSGLQYKAMPMTEAPATLKHELTPVVDGRQWFIRFYFVAEPTHVVMFISVHPSSHWRRPRPSR